MVRALRPAPRPVPFDTVHIYLPPVPAPRASAHDAAPRRPAPRRPGDQEGEPEGEPVLLCVIKQNGETGEWSGEGPDGNPIVVSHAGDGLGGRDLWAGLGRL
jgi:hypothetical protein